MRYFLDISYHGGDYHGWQRQTNSHTVQQEIENCLGTILQQSIQITGSGRTDTGVHAKQQIAHVDIELSIPEKDFLHKANSILPPSIALKGIRQVKDEAHARFDAIERTYHYFIHDRKDPFKQGQSYYFKLALDIKKINQALEMLKAQKDFQSFSKVKTEVNNFICEIKESRWRKVNDGHIFEITANRFLRGMVRAIVGTLIDLGLGKLSLQDFALILDKRDRRQAGAAAPAEGLFLTSVIYPDEIYR